MTTQFNKMITQIASIAVLPDTVKMCCLHYMYKLNKKEIKVNVGLFASF